MADLGVRAADKVLLVWAQPAAPAALKEYAEELGAIVGAEGKVAVENMERLLLCELCYSLFSPRKSCFFKFTKLQNYWCSLLTVVSLQGICFKLCLCPLFSLSCSIHIWLRALLPSGRQLLHPQLRDSSRDGQSAETWREAGSRWTSYR